MDCWQSQTAVELFIILHCILRSKNNAHNKSKSQQLPQQQNMYNNNVIPVAHKATGTLDLKSGARCYVTACDDSKR